jgi:hypothetical protein
VKTDSAESCDGHAYLEGLSGFSRVHPLERHDIRVIASVSDLHMPLGRFYVVRGVDREPSCVRQERSSQAWLSASTDSPVFSGRGAKYRRRNETGSIGHRLVSAHRHVSTP